MHEILERTTSATDRTVTRVVDGPEIRRCDGLRGRSDCAPGPGVCDQADAGVACGIAVCDAARHALRAHASLRAAQALSGGKIHAINRGQAFVSIDDIRSAALPALRHRILSTSKGRPMR